MTENICSAQCVVLPNKKYNTIVIDPPWPITMAGKYSDPRHSRSEALPYHTLPIDEIQNIDIGGVCSPGAHVYLWSTNSTLRTAFHLFDGWGINHHLTLVMVKKSGIAPSCGWVFGTEFCLLGFYGKPMQPFTNMGMLNWVIVNPKKGEHSKKPDEFFRRVESTSPGPYLEVFAREYRYGWDVVGDELYHDYVPLIAENGEVRE